jgi:hypothetical protein
MHSYVILFLAALVLSCLFSLLLWSVLKPWEKPLRQAHLDEPEDDAVIEGTTSQLRVIAP